MTQTAPRTRYTVTEDEARAAINSYYGSAYAWDAGCLAYATTGPQPVIAQTFVPSSRTRRDGTRMYYTIPYGIDESYKLARWRAINHA